MSAAAICSRVPFSSAPVVINREASNANGFPSLNSWAWFHRPIVDGDCSCGREATVFSIDDSGFFRVASGWCDECCPPWV